MSKTFDLPSGQRVTRYWSGGVGGYGFQLHTSSRVQLGEDGVISEDDVVALFADLVGSWGAPAMAARLAEKVNPG